MSPRIAVVLTLVCVSQCYSQTNLTPEQQFILGRLFHSGKGVVRDDVQAAAWFRKAADQGNIDAQLNLGFMYEDGEGVPQDTAEAARWFRKAADQGNAAAQSFLGVLYYAGQGVPQDYNEAVRLYRKAGDQGFAVAQNNLGEMFDNGHGVPRDYIQAAFWYRKAAEQGDADAQNNLGRMYYNGQGVSQDYAQAAVWFRRAANQGHADAQLSLGDMYAEGTGVVQDYVSAHMWFNLAAAATGNPLASLVVAPKAKQERDLLTGKMSREQIAEAQEMARNWKPTETSTGGELSGIAGSLPQLDATGTGFFVSRQGEIITNDHVIDGCSLLKTQTSALTVIARDTGNDLALLKSAQPVPQFATFSGRPVRAGQSVMAVGYPLRGLLSSGASVTTGNVSALAGPNDDTGLLQITAPVQPGNSGGPLLDQSSNVVGVVVSKLDSLKVARATGDIPQNVNFAIKAAIVRSFLETNGVEFSTAASITKLDPAVVAERAIKFTVVVECWK